MFNRLLSVLTLSIVLLILLAQPIMSEEKQDFSVKGFHIDLRCQVMTMPALKAFAKDISEMGINTIIMEWEGTFPYVYNATISNKFAYTREEIKSFVSYCSSIGIDVIPLQNCFGHVEYILRHDRYVALRESVKEVSQVCPMESDNCKAVFTELFTEMVKLHPSKYFHIGGDETYLLGSCKKCATKVEAEGKSKLFVDYVKMMCEIVKAMGKQPILWADILLKYPEAAIELPKDVIFVDWNYGWGKNHFGNVDSLLNKGFTFWGAPSIRCHPDNMYLTQWEKHFSNINTFIPYARKANYKGMVMTSWSTSGTYGFSYDSSWEVINMQPIREVYPLSGFRILVAAYGESLKSDVPLNPMNFVENYGQKRFGFTVKESELLWQILKTPQELIKYGEDSKNREVTDIKVEAINLQKEMSSLTPKKNKMEFEHLRLMLDIRVQYLSFKEIEARYQSREFDRNKALLLLNELKPLLSEATKIDKRFITLNKGFLYDEELKELNRQRNEKLHIMYDTLKAIAR